jgi:hypothetical protein
VCGEAAHYQIAVLPYFHMENKSAIIEWEMKHAIL